jgi:hypothetical protein
MHGGWKYSIKIIKKNRNHALNVKALRAGKGYGVGGWGLRVMNEGQ